MKRTTPYVAALGLCAAATVAALGVSASSAPLEATNPSWIRVVDGDTIKVRHETVRILGLDAPEVGEHAHCAVELELGTRAKAELTRMLSAQHRVTIRRSVWPDGERRLDRYGRTLARVYSDGKDVGRTLIGRGLAHAYNGRGRRGGWC